ncbi:MAG: type I secretion system permease/ATPase [Verrucomicrobiota bacterium]
MAEVETISADSEGEPAENAEEPIEHHDPLLDCLMVAGKLHGKALSRDSVTMGLPLVDNRLTPDLFIRAADRGGLTAKLVRRPLRKISDLILPVVLILEEGHACVLTKHDGVQAEVISPDIDDGSTTVSLKELKKSYTGYAIFLKPKFDYEERADLKVVPRASSWFWGTLWRFKKLYIKLIPASILINLFAIASPIFIMTTYDRVVPNQAMETLTVLAVGASIVFGFEFLIRMLRGYFIDRAGKRADVLMASALYEQILGIEMSAKPASSGAFANQARAYESLREFFTSATMVALIDLPFVFLFVYLVFVIGGTAVALVPLSAAVLVLAMGLLLQFPLKHAVKSSYQTGMQRHALLVEMITGLEAVKGASAEANFQRRIEECVRESAELEVKSRWYSSLATTMTSFIHHMVTIGVVVVSVYEIKEGNMTQGAMIACVILSGRGLAPLAKVAGLLTRLQQSMTALHGLNQIMKMPRERAPGQQHVSRPDFRPEIDFKEVSFAYPGQKVAALKEVSFHIKPGERVAILGKIGSGKSTMLRMLMKFYQPSGGLLKISGTDITQLNPSEIRRQAGYVPQEATLFYGSIKDNILMGSPWSGDEPLKKAAGRTGVNKFVENHPMGYDRPVGERGSMLSGGQRQCVVLARALLTEPDLLLFDEPTSGMDSTAEREFSQDVLSYLNENSRRTLVLATHKPSLLALVDRIIILDDGRIVANGPKQEVLAKIQGGAKPDQ